VASDASSRSLPSAGTDVAAAMAASLYDGRGRPCAAPRLLRCFSTGTWTTTRPCSATGTHVDRVCVLFLARAASYDVAASEPAQGSQGSSGSRAYMYATVHIRRVLVVSYSRRASVGGPPQLLRSRELVCRRAFIGSERPVQLLS